MITSLGSTSGMAVKFGALTRSQQERLGLSVSTGQQEIDSLLDTFDNVNQLPVMDDEQATKFCETIQTHFATTTYGDSNWGTRSDQYHQDKFKQEIQTIVQRLKDMPLQVPEKVIVALETARQTIEDRFSGNNNRFPLPIR